MISRVKGVSNTAQTTPEGSAMDTTAQIVSIIVGPLLAAYVAWRLNQIHRLVNSRLTGALDEIKRLGGDEKDF